MSNLMQLFIHSAATSTFDIRSNGKWKWDIQNLHCLIKYDWPIEFKEKRATVSIQYELFIPLVHPKGSIGDWRVGVSVLLGFSAKNVANLCFEASYEASHREVSCFLSGVSHLLFLIKCVIWEKKIKMSQKHSPPHQMGWMTVSNANNLNVRAPPYLS